MDTAIGTLPVPWLINIGAGARARYRPVGALRLCLALMVVAQHFQHLLPPQTRSPFSRMGLGIVAVTVFFVISGFVVSEANAVFYRGRPGAFLANRALRLVPPYLAALAVSMAAHAVLYANGMLVLWDFSGAVDPLSLSALVAGICGIVPGFHPGYVGQDFEFIPYAWSLRVEMAFYVAATLALVAGLAWRRAVAGAALLGLLASVMLLPGAGPSVMSNVPMFLAGVGLYAVVARSSVLRVMFAICACGGVALGFASLGQHGTPDLPAQFALLGGLLTVFALLATVSAEGRWQRLDRWFGDLSYPLYLNHYAIGIIMSDLGLPLGKPLYLAGAGLSVCLAWAMGRLVDLPLKRLRARVRRATV